MHGGIVQIRRMWLLKYIWEVIKFYGRCLAIAFWGGYGFVNAISTALFAASDWAAHKQPVGAISSPWLEWLKWIGGWESLAVIFGSVALVRVVLAPYWIWKKERDDRLTLEGRFVKVDELEKVETALIGFAKTGKALRDRFLADLQFPKAELDVWWDELTTFIASHPYLGKAYIARLNNPKPSSLAFLQIPLELSNQINVIDAYVDILVQFVTEFSERQAALTSSRYGSLSA